MKRRSLLKNIVSVSVLSLGGVAALQYYQQSQLRPAKPDNFDYLFLTEQDRIVLEVLIPVFVAGLSLNDIASINKVPINKASINKVSINKVTQNIDSAIVRLPIRTQVELRELFELLASAFGRLMLANVWLNWQSASAESVDEFLAEWRDSRIDLLKIAYKGLHKLIVGSVYAEQAVWSAIGYAGPPQISLSQV